MDISFCKKLTENAGMMVGSNCPNIKVLKVAYCSDMVTDVVLKTIGNGCKFLIEFDFSYCKAVTDEGLESLSQSKQSFTSLLVNGLDNISGIGVAGLLRNSSSTLQCLEISLLDPVIFPIKG